MANKPVSDIKQHSPTISALVPASMVLPWHPSAMDYKV